MNRNRQGLTSTSRVGSDNACSDKRRIGVSAIRDTGVLNETRDHPKKVFFSHGMGVGWDGSVMLFISGTASVNENGHSIHVGDVTAQRHRALAKPSGASREQGLDPLPAGTCIEARMRRPELSEIEAIAMVQEDRCD